ncbi:MAG: hypothetical protein Q9M36_07020 [Sulfurovum sp.]|nr:hypothetical protein [Sulfurovum sp.]
MDDEGQESRINLKLCNTETLLDFVQASDSKNIDIFYDEVYIGSTSQILEGKIEVVWDGEAFFIRQRQIINIL